MLILKKFSLVAVALGAGLAFAMPPLPAAAQQQPTQEQPTWEQPAPEPFPEARDSGGSGLYYLLDFSLGNSKNANTNANFKANLDWSTSFGLGVGYRVGPLRIEGEFSNRFYRVGSIDLGVGSPFLVADYAGGIQSLNAMANVFVDLPTAGQMRPYLGAGMGIARVSAQYNESVCIIYCFSTSNEVVDDWDIVPTWQAMAGASFAMGSPNREWFIGYRYSETQDLKLNTLLGTTFVQEGIKDHSIMAGFRFLID